MLPPSLNLYTPMPVSNSRSGDERLQHESPVLLLKEHAASWDMISSQNNMEWQHMLPGHWIKHKDCKIYCFDYDNTSADMFKGPRRFRKKLTNMFGEQPNSTVLAPLREYNSEGYKDFMNILTNKQIPYAIFLQEEYCGKEELIYLKTKDKELVSKRSVNGIYHYLDSINTKHLQS